MDGECSAPDYLRTMPSWTYFLFILALIISLVGIWRSWRSPMLIGVLIVLGALHGSLAWMGFYIVSEGFPPRPALLLGPVVLAIALLVLLPQGRAFLLRGDMVSLVWLSILRVPVELVLHEGWLQGLVPRMLTYEGLNYDILAGLSAPLIAFHLMRATSPSRNLLLGWNVACLLLLLNVVIRALLSFPSTFQLLNLDTPMILVQHLPWILLPAVIVPIVLLSHVAMLVQLTRRLPPEPLPVVPAI